MTDSDEIHIVERDDVTPHRPASHTESSQYETLYGNNFPRDLEFQQVVWEAEMAIATGGRPELSVKGTSGCYFVKDRNAVSLLDTTPTKHVGVSVFDIELKRMRDHLMYLEKIQKKNLEDISYLEWIVYGIVLHWTPKMLVGVNLV